MCGHAFREKARPRLAAVDARAICGCGGGRKGAVNFSVQGVDCSLEKLVSLVCRKRIGSGELLLKALLPSGGQVFAGPVHRVEVEIHRIDTGDFAFRTFPLPSTITTRS